MYPYQYYSVYDDEYEQYLRAQQLQRQRQRQAYEQQLHHQRLLEQQYLQQQFQEQQQLRQRYQEQQLLQQQYLEQQRREQQQLRKLYERQVEVERRRRQQAEQRRCARTVAEREKAAARAAHEQALREQLVDRHQDEPVTLSFFDLLDYLQQQQQREHQSEDDELIQSNEPSLSDFEEEETAPPAQAPAPERFVRLESPELVMEPEPIVREPQSPDVEELTDAFINTSISPPPSFTTTKASASATSSAPARKQHSKKRANKKADIDDAIQSKSASASAHASSIAGEAAGLLKTLKPRLDLEVERANSIFDRKASDLESSKLKLKNLKEAHLRVEAIYTQLDEMRVLKKLRAQKHQLTSTAVGLADKIDEEITSASAKVKELQSSEDQSKSVPGSPTSSTSSAKHHVILEDVDELEQ